MTTSAFCPCCGYDLAVQEPVSFGLFDCDPRGLVSWRGSPVIFTTSEHIILSSIALAGGRFVSRAALSERLGYDGLNNLIEVFMSRVRHKLRLAGAPANLIQTQHGRGYRLNLDVVGGPSPHAGEGGPRAEGVGG